MHGKAQHSAGSCLRIVILGWLVPGSTSEGANSSGVQDEKTNVLGSLFSHHATKKAAGGSLSWGCTRSAKVVGGNVNGDIVERIPGTRSFKRSMSLIDKLYFASYRCQPMVERMTGEVISGLLGQASTLGVMLLHEEGQEKTWLYLQFPWVATIHSRWVRRTKEVVKLKESSSVIEER